MSDGLKAIRRMREKTGRITLKEWQNKLQEYNHSCAFCQIKENLEQDHIIPLAKGGEHKITNIQPLCRSCNAKKHIKVISI
jgi:5-methylcytosine-specific restriction endonuclease McrA